MRFNTFGDINNPVIIMLPGSFLGRNMAYYLKCIEAGKEIELPKQEQMTFTNFIR